LEIEVVEKLLVRPILLGRLVHQFWVGADNVAAARASVRLPISVLNIVTGRYLDGTVIHVVQSGRLGVFERVSKEDIVGEGELRGAATVLGLAGQIEDNGGGCHDGVVSY
jgi:hypothetical protein